ncbi:MAG: Fic family protein, partial [Myxococcaceae bacterium]
IKELLSENTYSEKDLWRNMIIQSNINPDSFRQAGKLWARAIPFLARFYKFFPFSNPKELRNKFVKIIEDTKKLYKTDPFEAAVFIHQALVKLHPLENGNGRMARFMMNIVLRQAGYPSIAMLSEQSYSSAVSGSSFSEFLTNRVCTTARAMREQGDSYGADISLLAQKCIQKTRKYYIEGHKEEADPVPECQNTFRLLLADYEQTRDEL